MTRAGKLISASMLASSALLAVAVWASAGARATPTAAARAACLPPGARTLASDHVAQVFSWQGSVYGCVSATGTRHKLGGLGICNVAPGRAAPVKLLGTTVAYGLERCGVDTGSSTVVIRDLASARELADIAAGTLPLGAESYVSVASLVLGHGSTVGWIATDTSLVRNRGQSYEVHGFTGAKSSLLDSGKAIRPSSLRLAGSRMTWRDGTATRSAKL
ncbi:MAG TPA: hypothetical protein VG186_07010 [Solirubrobacteraceae bacterium]|jgi:hypothetical protein|nr:hypothetical protein [Solirubrobacteraceae bacterium]